MTFKFKRVEIAATLKILKSIQGSKSAGSDNIPASMLKDAAEKLAAPISFLTELSFLTGVFPTAKKTAKVKPLYISLVNEIRLTTTVQYRSLISFLKL